MLLARRDCAERKREIERERKKRRERSLAARSRFCTRHEGRVQVRSAAHPLPLEASNHLSTGTSRTARLVERAFGGKKERKSETSEGVWTR